MTDDGLRTDGGAAQGDEVPERGEDALDGEADDLAAMAEPTREDPPEDAIASKEDFVHKRDADEGDLLPVTQKLPGRDQYVKVIPLRQGDADKYLPDHGDPRALDDDEILELFRKFYVAPDFSDVEDLSEFLAFGVDPLLMALMNASGFDLAKGMLTENSDLAQAIEGNSRGGN